MEKKEFRITINAPKEKVWKTLWNNDSYRQWTSVFSEGSRAETDWQQGSKVRFLNDRNEGLVSRIAENRLNEYMSFEHLGMVVNGVEDYDDEKMKQWAGAHENYSLKGVGNTTELTIDVDITQEYLEYFNDTWPQALQKLKMLAEQN